MRYRKTIVILLFTIILLLVSANLMLFYLCNNVESYKQSIRAQPKHQTVALYSNSVNTNLDNLVVRNSQKGEPEEMQEIHENYKINISSGDIDLIAKLLYLEGRGESEECQRAIVSVIINRLKSGYWGSTYHDVIFAKNQFEPAGSISKTTAGAKQYEIIEYVMKNGTTLPKYVLYFRANYFFDWCVDYKKIDNTYFSYTKKDFDKLGGK